MAVDRDVDFRNEINTIVILGPSDSRLSSDIVEQILGNLTTTFMNLGYQIVERRRLDTIVQELALSYEDFFSEDTAKEIGKMIGSDALVVLSGIDADYQTSVDKRGNSETELVVRRATLQILDLATAAVAFSLNFNDPQGLTVFKFAKMAKKKTRFGTGFLNFLL